MDSSRGRGPTLCRACPRDDPVRKQRTGLVWYHYGEVSRSANDKKLFFEINARGQIKPSALLAARLAEVPGLWRMVPEIGQLMVLDRVVDNRHLQRSKARDRRVRLAGVFDESFVLASVLNLIQFNRLDGVLNVNREQVQKSLYFRKGVYLAGRSNLTRDRLGHVLVRVGMLSAERRDDCIAALADGSRMGTVLVAKKYLTTPQVYEGLRKQAEEIFFSLLRLDAGSFNFVQPLDMTEVPAMIRLDVEGLLLEGMRRIDEAAASEDDEELQRSRPIPAAELPADGPQRIVATYKDALARLFAAVTVKERLALRAELARFIKESVPYRELFDKITVGGDGSIRGDIVANMTNITSGEPSTILQLGLNEMLFFIMFAAGDAVEPDVEQILQRDVARALGALLTFTD